MTEAPTGRTTTHQQNDGHVGSREPWPLSCQKRVNVFSTGSLALLGMRQAASKSGRSALSGCWLEPGLGHGLDGRAPHRAEVAFFSDVLRRDPHRQSY